MNILGAIVRPFLSDDHLRPEFVFTWDKHDTSVKTLGQRSAARREFLQVLQFPPTGNVNS